MRLTLLLCSVLCLAACGKEDVAAIQQQAAQGWENAARAQLLAHEETILADKKAPMQHRQLARAFSRMVYDCAIERRGDRTWKAENALAMEFREEESRCAHRLINQTLVQGGSDRAYEASLAAKSIEPDWFQPVLPSYMSVD